MVLISLFLSFFRTGLFAIGGAYSFIPLIEREVVDKYHWLAKEEFLEIMGVVKIFPGAISIKYATYTGFKVAGFAGAVAANVGNICAPFILAIFAFTLYAKYKNIPNVKSAFNAVQLAVFAMIIAVAFQLININQLLHLKNILIIIVCFSLFIYTKIHPALIISAVAILGAFSMVR